MTLTCPRCKSYELTIKAELANKLWHLSVLVECSACLGLSALIITEQSGEVHLVWGTTSDDTEAAS